ncbi:capsular biosynthesis protein [Paraburkholderia sp. BR14263]|uniref:capsular polysaccharide export protein, LipB/KpsS family n=1 Tax=unclassified Paraburkholderia TaxID=2615204 RepID=UPI0034CFDF2D
MILIVVDSLERYYFAARLVHAVRGEYDFLFLTSEPVAHLRLKCAGYRSYYLRKVRNPTLEVDESCTEYPYDRSIEVLNGQVSRERARVESCAVVRRVSSLLTRFSVTQCFMWNGQQLVCRAVSHACLVHGVPQRFLEISNLPGKLFVDSSGVNALSSICRDPAVIDRLSLPDEETHRRWLMHYESAKSRPLPQARTSLKRKVVSGVNYVLKFASSGVGRKRLATVRARNGGRRPVDIKNYVASELSTQRYVFLPLQVSGDTQIKLHSEIDNLGAIRHALEFAVTQDAALLVKLHPAENDESAISAIEAMRDRCQFTLVSSPTTDLIKHAQAVVTINSTVGLEGLLYGKRVISLGQCFYKNFDRTRLLKYIHSFLIDGVDYFSSGGISPEAARKVFSIEH